MQAGLTDRTDQAEDSRRRFSMWPRPQRSTRGNGGEPARLPALGLFPARPASRPIESIHDQVPRSSKRLHPGISRARRESVWRAAQNFAGLFRTPISDPVSRVIRMTEASRPSPLIV